MHVEGLQALQLIVCNSSANQIATFVSDSIMVELYYLMGELISYQISRRIHW